MQVAAGGENADGRLAEPRNGLTTSESSGLMRHPKHHPRRPGSAIRVALFAYAEHRHPAGLRLSP